MALSRQGTSAPLAQCVAAPLFWCQSGCRAEAPHVPASVPARARSQGVREGGVDVVVLLPAA